MVALAPITNETPTWDVLDTFPKLHSRAREEKTTPCTEAPHSKSLDRVEIWLTIYETCEGLESFTRDPIGFDGGSNFYSLVSNSPLSFVDPLGECKQVCCTGTNNTQFAGIYPFTPEIEQPTFTVNCPPGMSDGACCNLLPNESGPYTSVPGTCPPKLHPGTFCSGPSVETAPIRNFCKEGPNVVEPDIGIAPVPIVVVLDMYACPMKFGKEIHSCFVFGPPGIGGRFPNNLARFQQCVRSAKHSMNNACLNDRQNLFAAACTKLANCYRQFP
jgi:hypothetical protein